MPSQRLTGRILSLGFPLPGVRVDNYSFVSAPSLFDYDALVVEPGALSQLVTGVIDGSAEARTFSGARVRLRAEEPSDVALEDLFRRRAEETAMFLRRGGVALLFGRTPVFHRPHEGAALRDDAWLGDAAPRLTPADGTTIEVSDYQHPLAAFVASQAANVRYAACAREPDLPAGARVFARSYGGAALGFEYAADHGRVVVLPALKGVPGGDGRYRLSDALQAGIQRALGVAGEGRAPVWVSGFDLPGLRERAEAVKAAREQLQTATGALGAAELSHDELARYQRLLWQQGRLGLDDAVVAALRLIGFTVYDSDADNLELRLGDVSVLLEVEASDADVDMTPHHRLRQRLERAIETRGTTPRGLIIINGFRHQHPSERLAQASAQLRAAAEQMQYAVCPASLLFDAVVAHFRSDEGSVAQLRERLVTAPGVLA